MKRCVWATKGHRRAKLLNGTCPLVSVTAVDFEGQQLAPTVDKCSAGVAISPVGALYMLPPLKRHPPNGTLSNTQKQEKTQ